MNFKDFNQFIQKQGVIGLAIGFILGGAISKLVTSLVEDIINPLLGVALGAAGRLADAQFAIGRVSISWGNFVTTFIDFLVIALVVYLLVKWLKIDKLQIEK